MLFRSPACSMLKLLCLLGLVVSGALAGALRKRRDHHSGEDCKCPNPARSGYYGGGYGGRSAFADPSIAEGRLLNQDARLEQLEHYFDDLTAKYEKFISGKDARVKRWNQLQDRVWGLEAHHCDDAHFSCRDNVYNCVGHDQVCDGFSDCLNGRDEDANTCRVVSDVGSAFEGRLMVQDPCTKRKPHAFRFVVTGVDIDPNFPQLPHVSAAVVAFYTRDGEEVEESMAVKGTYDYTHRRIILVSPDSDSLVFECSFDNYNDDYCSGEIRRESGASCAKFGLGRIG